MESAEIRAASVLSMAVNELHCMIVHQCVAIFHTKAVAIATFFFCCKCVIAYLPQAWKTKYV